MIEAAIIISVLLSFVEQLMTSGRLSPNERVDQAVGPGDGEHNEKVKKILKRMRIQIWAGTLVGFFISLCIGAAFIAVVSCSAPTQPWLTL
jgi:high-affinity iron transporter